MSELGPIAKLYVDGARKGFGPDDEAIARMRAHIAASVAVGVGATTAGVKTASAAAGTKAGVGLAITKIVAVVIVAGLATGTVVAIHASNTPTAVPAPRTSVVNTMPPPVNAPAPVAMAEPPTHAPPQPAPVVVAPAPPIHQVAVAKHAPAPAPAPPPSVPPRLGREVALLDQAGAALREHRPADALATLATYDRETADHGQLAEDAAAIELEALCTLHSPEVAAKLAAFDLRWPRSAQRERIQGVCR